MIALLDFLRSESFVFRFLWTISHRHPRPQFKVHIIVVGAKLP